MPADGNSYDKIRLIFPPKEEDPPQEQPYDSAPDDSAHHEEASPLPAAHFPFVALGHDHGRFFFSGSGAQVRDFSARELHGLPALCELASLSFWEVEYPAKKGVDVRAAGAALMQSCFRVGIYDPTRLRGRGAWLDEDQIVLHLGDRLIVNGQDHGLSIPSSRFIYEHSVRLSLPIADPLPVEDAKRLLDLCMLPTWESPAHMGRLLAGWCVVAPVCGAMPWRPHLWVTGEKSSGKSWIMENIVAAIVGEIGFHVQSVTTEAGIRQDLGSDARPVIFDEAETQTEADRVRIQNVLNLARQASTEGGAAIVKGSANGRATHYRIRSMFAFSSINYGVTQAADESRVVSLSLRADTAPGSQERFAEMRRRHAEIVTPEFSARLMARTISLIPTIRRNADVFADAIARAGHGRRTGDTVGVLLAGAWALRSGKTVSAQEADRFLNETSWLKQAVSKSEVQPEWQRAIAFLLQHRTRVTRERGSEDVPVAELVAAVSGRGEPGLTTPKDADHALARIGLRVVHDALHVWNNSTEIAGAFARSPWAAGWLPTLARTPGAAPAANPIRFGANGKQRALCIPIAAIMQDDDG